MAITFFSKRERRLSSRLTLIGRYFQLSGIIIGAVTIGTGIAALLGHAPNVNLGMSSAVLLTYLALNAVSAFQIGRGLLLRQRWAGYLALFTFGAPLIRNVVKAGADFPIGTAIYPVLALLAIASVWRELGSVRDSEFDAYDDDDDDDLPKRNRGFGEKRELRSPVTHPTAQKPSTKIPEQQREEANVADFVQRGS